jgi:hypothetical protein
MVAVNVSPVVNPENVNVPDVLAVMGVVELAVTSWNVIVLETALGFGVNVILTDVGVTWERVGAAGWANCGKLSVSGLDTVPIGEEAKFTPSPIDVMDASYVSPGVSPVMCAEPEVLPVVVVDVLVVVLVSVIVLDVALGSGVKVTVMEVGVVWLSAGAAGLANAGSVSVSGADVVPVGDEAKFTPSPTDVMVAV